MLYFLMETALGGDLYSIYLKNSLHGPSSSQKNALVGCFFFRVSKQQRQVGCSWRVLVVVCRHLFLRKVDMSPGHQERIIRGSWPQFSFSTFLTDLWFTLKTPMYAI